MSTKPLYILIQDGQDGSYYPKYTFNTELVTKLRQAFDNEQMDWENGIAIDGDGFHYETLTVPVECTAESLGIQGDMLADDYCERFITEEEEGDE